MQIVLARVFPPSIDNHHKAAGVGLSEMQGQTSFPPPQVAEVSENSTNTTCLAERETSLLGRIPALKHLLNLGDKQA